MGLGATYAVHLRLIGKRVLRRYYHSQGATRENLLKFGVSEGGESFSAGI